MNNEQIEDLLGTNKPMPDMSKEFSHEEAFEYAASTGSPAKVGVLPIADEFESQNLYVISERAYKYFLSKCTEDELWDTGFLGCSAEHVRSSEHVLPLR